MLRPAAAGRAALVALTLLAAPAAGARERSEIPEKYRWKLGDLFPSVDAWKQARADLQQRIARLPEHRGHLGDSAEALRRGLDAVYGATRDLQRIQVYAQSLSDQDTRVASNRELKQAAEQLGVDLDAATSFVRPEILALDPAKVRAFVAQDPGLAPYRFPLEDILRWKPHTLSTGEERVVAEAGAVTGAGHDAFSVLVDADLPYPTIKLSSGKEVRLDQSAYEVQRASTVRADRDRAFEGFLGALREFRGTAGVTLYSSTRAHLFTKKVRGFDSALEAALFPSNIPTSVYQQLVRDVRRSLPTLHRYLALRKRMLGVETLRYQDLYVPLVAKVDMRFTPEQAQQATLEAVKPLGDEYVSALRGGLQGGWTDWLPSTGKRSGAYSTGVYGVHPYQLLNFNDRYEDLSTLAHEAGHSMHTWLAHKTQPFPTAEYPIFVAEVASTLNENLLFHDQLRKATDDATRLSLLGGYLERLRQTLFRQTQFAEFELAFHQMAEKGETLTGENLSALYLRITRDYYGHDKGVCQVDDLIGAEWAYISHFYYNFYVYQYATSLVASTALAKGIREEAPRGETRRRDAYLKLLRAGGSQYPMDLLREAGVDLNTSAPFDASIAEMNGIIDEMERILARSPRRQGE
jgi:oligoendopeptidase F